MTVFAVVIACLVVGGFSHPKQPTFPSCQSRVCHSGANTGYGCRGGVCDYTCSESSCHGFGNAVFPHKGMQETWGSGALGKHGCYGGNCGYWSGCNDGKCSDFYDFQQCQHVKCVNGSFHGYGCSTGGNCRVVCFIDVCHSVDNYGKVYQPSIPAPKRPHYEDVFYVNKTSKSSQSTKGEAVLHPTKVVNMALAGKEFGRCNASSISFDASTRLRCLRLQYGRIYIAISGSRTSIRERYRGEYGCKTAPTDGRICTQHDAILSSVNLDISQTTTPNEPSKAPVAKKSDAKTSQRATDMPDAANMTDAEYANVLFNKEPRFVQYIIENHQNLPGLLANMNAQTLQYVAAQVPTFGKIISNLSRNTLEVVFDKLPNTAKCLADMEPEVVRAIVAKLPSLAQYAPTEPSTTAAPTTPTPTPQVQTIVTVPTTVALRRLSSQTRSWKWRKGMFIGKENSGEADNGAEFDVIVDADAEAQDRVAADFESAADDHLVSAGSVDDRPSSSCTVS
ncbi:hypothetical protein ECG_07464 [Echinococcus granulosus]|nr:hypothetical protein ECG_07464 [Echinococcus granulosus]